MKIYSTAFGPHDHNTYDGILHKQYERYTRLKHNMPYDLNSFFKEYFKSKTDILAFTTTIGGYGHIVKPTLLKEFLNWKPASLWDYKKIGNRYYIDHHQSHAAYAFLCSKYKQSDILAIDGRGWKYNCLFFNKDGKIFDLSESMGIGQMWDKISVYLGFGTLGAGKVMGLSAYGSYSEEVHTIIDYYRDNNFSFPKNIKNVIKENKPEDVAYTLQHVTQELVIEYVYPLKSCNNLCVAGGVAYNGYINNHFLSHYKNVFVPPAPGDEGQSLGTYMHADKIINNNIHIPNTYAGEKYNYVGDEKLNIKNVAQQLADGKIIGWYQGKSESGNRALGNRSILANPSIPNIKDIINRTIKMREDFRPFAPAVLEEHYKDYFDTDQPSPYMSRIVNVKRNKFNIIPGVIHIDGTARIQTVNKYQNKKFYNLIKKFYNITGIPMLLNTSFNCQEPIVETPEQAITTFRKTALDLLVINDWIIRS